MSRLSVDLESPDAYQKALEASERNESFDLVVSGRRAERLWKVIPCYERFNASFPGSPGRIKSILDFGLRGIRSPLFWAICIICSPKNGDLNFIFDNGVLRARFSYQPQR